MPRPNIPYLAYCFRVEIDGLPVASFQSVQGLESKINITEYREGTFSGGVAKIAGFEHYESNLVLSRGYTQANSAFSDWIIALREGQLLRRNGSVVLCDEAGNDRIEWAWEDGILCSLTGPDFDATMNDVAVQRAEICYTRLTPNFLGD